MQIRRIEPYSARKKNTKTTAACSVINPLTNSDSNKKKKSNALHYSCIGLNR